MQIIESNIARFSIYATSFVIIMWLTSHYFPINADYANSPLVWREFISRGSDAFFDWKPTPDNWYFSVYPVHFALFYILNDDGVVPLIIASSLFTWFVAFFSGEIVRKTTNSWHYIPVVVCITFLPKIMYHAGFVPHPFAHNSTNAYGLAMLMLAAGNIINRKYWITALIGAIGLFVNASDMWISPTYFLPIIICEAFLFFKNKSGLKHIVILGLFFFLAVFHVIPKIMGFPIQQFKIVDLEQIFLNINMCTLLIGETINIFYFSSSLSYYLSTLVWLILSTWAVIVCFKRGGYTQYIAFVVYLSLAGIVSSFILSNPSPFPGPPRFFVNVAPCVFILAAMAIKISDKKILSISFLMFLVSSLSSYDPAEMYMKKKVNENNEYITFLKENNLKYGYGDFWDLSMTVNWLSNGDILIVPVILNKDLSINYKYPRAQTFKSWMTDDFRKTMPDRQFIAVSSGGECKDTSECIKGIIKQVGNPDQIIKYKKINIMIYNHRINFK